MASAPLRQSAGAVAAVEADDLEVAEDDVDRAAHVDVTVQLRAADAGDGLVRADPDRAGRQHALDVNHGGRGSARRAVQRGQRGHGDRGGVAAAGGGRDRRAAVAGARAGRPAEQRPGRRRRRAGRGRPAGPAARRAAGSGRAADSGRASATSTPDTGGPTADASRPRRAGRAAHAGHAAHAGRAAHAGHAARAGAATGTAGAARSGPFAPAPAFIGARGGTATARIDENSQRRDPKNGRLHIQ